MDTIEVIKITLTVFVLIVTYEELTSVYLGYPDKKLSCQSVCYLLRTQVYLNDFSSSITQIIQCHYYRFPPFNVSKRNNNSLVYWSTTCVNWFSDSIPQDFPQSVRHGLCATGPARTTGGFGQYFPESSFATIREEIWSGQSEPRLVLRFGFLVMLGVNRSRVRPCKLLVRRE